MTFEGWWPINCYYDKKERLKLVLRKGDKITIIGYSRFLYENQLDEPLSKGMQVHHMDFDKNNNDLSNLVALPRGQHKKYHHCVDYIRSIPAKQKKTERAKVVGQFDFEKCTVEILTDRQGGKHTLLRNEYGRRTQVRNSEYEAWKNNFAGKPASESMIRKPILRNNS
jgi:hypothetical protein